jgi:hypothetical protein
MIPWLHLRVHHIAIPSGVRFHLSTSYYGKCRTKFPDKVLGLLKIDLARQVTERLTGVARGSNAQEKHTPETKIATEADCRSTTGTHNALLLQIDGNRGFVHRNAQVEGRTSEQG